MHGPGGHGGPRGGGPHRGGPGGHGGPRPGGFGRMQPPPPHRRGWYGRRGCSGCLMPFVLVFALLICAGIFFF